MTFNFLHFSIQEYLAAYYITSLQDEKNSESSRRNFGVIFISICSPYT